MLVERSSLKANLLLRQLVGNYLELVNGDVDLKLL